MRGWGGGAGARGTARGTGGGGAWVKPTLTPTASFCLLFLATVGLTAALPPPPPPPPQSPQATSSGDKPTPDRWDGHITYDYTRQKMGGTYGGKITEVSHPLSKNPAEEKEGGEPREASCPPPTNRCQGPKCHSDDDCPKAGSGCCFNGCIKTCSFLVDPPAVVDWIEESPALSPALVSDKDVPLGGDGGGGGGSSLEDGGHLLESVTAPDMVTLDGCILTPKQKEHLDELRQSSSIGSCFCQDGDVSCHVQHKDEAASSQGHLVLRNS